MALVRAIPLVNALTAALSTSDVSTGYNFAPSTVSPQKVYAALHLSSGFITTGRMLSIVIQSASSSGFPAGVANRVTFTLSTVQGAQWGTPAAVSTDQPWWRASWTMSTALSTGGTWKFLTHFGLK